MFETQINKLEKLGQLVSMTDNAEIEAMSKFLYERIKHPDSYVVFLGETSSGKSSIINGLLNAPVLPMKANPTTAAITEIELNNEVSDAQYYAINKNATIEKIDRNLFLELSEKPDDQLKRLKVITHNDQIALDHLRIFDTPGYGSIVAEHEEVLKEFLPNSDIIIYTVNYKIGIQDEDYAFLGFLRELIREDVKIFLLINRCPEGIDEKSPKIRSITRFVSDILTIDPTVFTVPNIVNDGQNGHPLPHSTALWASVGKVLNSPERIKILGHAFDQYIEDLYHECYKIIESKYLSAKISVEEFEEIKRLKEESAHRIRHAIPTLVIPVFEKIEQKLPSKFDEVRYNVQKRLDNEIDISDRTGMEEMVSYTNSHLLPYTIKTETAEIQNYVDIELEDLNKKVDDYLQKEIVRFNNEITIQLQTNVGAATSSIMAGMLKEVGKNSLQGYFATFGGMGGANAGVANVASHLLKKAGDLFGHTFSRATHNGVKHFLSKIGATSMKAVGAAIAVVTELLFVAYQLATWKGTLKNKISKALVKWEDETCVTVIEDLNKLKEENINTIRQIADKIAHTFDDVKAENIDECYEHYQYAQKLGKELNIE
ncbi:MAG: dynamin family protein [Bacteroidaceae bacterium]|nr:dynamin family protein [Bacteroidaceae bacterium]